MYVYVYVYVYIYIYIYVYGSATPEDEQDVIALLGLSPIAPTGAASLFLVRAVYTLLHMY